MLASRALDFLPICYIIPHPGEHGNLIFIKMVKTLLLTLQFTRQPLAGKAHARMQLFLLGLTKGAPFYEQS